MISRFAVLILIGTLAAASITAWGQPYDGAVIFGQGRSVNPDYDSVRFCTTYLPLASLDAYSDPSDVPVTDFLPGTLPDVSAVNPPSNGIGVRYLFESTNSVFTDPEETEGQTRPWLISNGTHTWDSTGRRIARYSLAPYHGQYKGGDNNNGISGPGHQLILPVRDTPGVFRHLVLEWSTLEGRRLILGESSFDLLLNYRLDARADWQTEVADQGAGRGLHARYSPDPTGDDRDHVEQAIAWQGDARSFEIPYVERPLRDSLADFPSISRITAVPHGNGRDYWVVAFGGQQRPRLMAAFLLDGHGELSLIRYDTAAVPFSPHFLSYGSRFGTVPIISQQGDRIAFHVTPDRSPFATPYGPGVGGYRDGETTDSTDGAGLAVWDFDRCSGEWSLFFAGDIDYEPSGNWTPSSPSNEVDPGHGIGFSPSGRYLYFAEATYIARFDLHSTDPFSEAKDAWRPDSLRARCNLGSPNLLFGPNARFHITPGLDGKLIMHRGGGTSAVIALGNLDAEDPLDITGGMCVLKSPCHNSNAFIQPYIQLYDLEGSSCDTLGIDGWQPKCYSWQSQSVDTVYLCDADGDGELDPTAWRGRTINTEGESIYTVRTPAGCDSLWRAVGIEVPAGSLQDSIVTANEGDVLSLGGDVGTFTVAGDTVLFVRYGPLGPDVCAQVVRYTITAVSSIGSVLSSTAQLTLYPSPLGTTGQLIVALPTSHTGGVLRWFDAAGRLVGQQVLAKAERDARIPARDLPNGAYVVTFTSVQGVFYGRGVR